VKYCRTKTSLRCLICRIYSRAALIEWECMLDEWGRESRRKLLLGWR
jgi:hypothetical protein